MDRFPAMLTLDPGKSDSKIIMRVSPFSKPRMLMMSPEVVDVSRERIDFYKSRRVTMPDPETEAWVEYEDTIYAVGFLAHKEFDGRVVMSAPKYEWAIAKVLAAVGVMVVKEGLPEEIDLALAVPLPFAEWEARHKFEQGIRKALGNFTFADRAISVNLKLFICVPEGGGLVVSRGEKVGASFNQKKIMVLMWGYRDISLVMFDRGVISGVTEALGFCKLIEIVQSRTFGQNSRARERLLLEAVHQAGKDIKSKNFKHLVLSRNLGRQADELEQITEAIRSARVEYWGTVSRFLMANTPFDVDEIIVGGGSYGFYRLELRNFLTQSFNRANVSWSADLEEDVRVAFNLSPEDYALGLRFADPYALSNFLRSQVCPSGTVKSSQR